MTSRGSVIAEPSALDATGRSAWEVTTCAEGGRQGSHLGGCHLCAQRQRPAAVGSRQRVRGD